MLVSPRQRRAYMAGRTFGGPRQKLHKNAVRKSAGGRTIVVEVAHKEQLLTVDASQVRSSPTMTRPRTASMP